MLPTRGAYDVPMALNTELSRTHGLHPDFAESRLKRHIADCKKCIIGPMPTDTFLKELLPLSSSDTRGRLSSRSAFSGIPQRADSPTRIYVPLLNALNKSTKTKSRCPGFKFVNTYERSRKPSDPGYAKPHICCFTPENANIVGDASLRSRSEFAYAELFFQVVSDPALDFFVDPPSEASEAKSGHDLLRKFEDHGALEEAELAYGLHIAYATEILARQHRLFLFSISLAGSFARFFRWDRAGCLVSEAFDVRQHPHLLTDFLWRFSQLSEAKRGLDTTVTLASPQEEVTFRDAITEEVRLQLDIAGDELEKAVSAHYLRGHVTIIPITPQQPSNSAENPHRFIVSRPIVSPLSLAGRGTRGFWAVDAHTGRVVFLKDCWRFYWAEEVEGDILRELNDLGVRNIPLLAVHGDVPMDPPVHCESELVSQSSFTDEFANDSWVCIVDGERVRVNEVWHYRLATFTVGYGLQTLRGTEELLYATHDALTAMKDAYTKDSRIHRDLSVGNIILVKEPDRVVRKGYLIDWEASDRVDDGGEALHAGRAGTWLFMSIRMLHRSQVNGKHTLADDLEALLYVVLYCALYYLPHNHSVEEVDGVRQQLFESYIRWPGGILHGGVGKLANAEDRLFTDHLHFESAALDEWLRTVMDFHCRRFGSKEGPENMWNIDKLDAFWIEFLETHALERDNRQVHTLPVDAPTDSSASSPYLLPPNPATQTKRRPSDTALDERSAPKALRLPAAAGVEPTTHTHQVAVQNASPTTPTTLRRSARIRAQRSALVRPSSPVKVQGAARKKSNKRISRRKARPRD